MGPLARVVGGGCGSVIDIWREWRGGFEADGVALVADGPAAGVVGAPDDCSGDEQYDVEGDRHFTAAVFSNAMERCVP